MVKLNKFVIVCLIAVFSLILAGCGENPDTKNQSSDVYTVTSTDSEDIQDEGIELPEEDFNTDDTSENGYVSNSSSNTNTEDDNKTSSSAETDNQNQSTSQSGEDITFSADDNTSSDEENTSSDDNGESSEDSDGSIELPFDKW